jgi:hypothetical protein
MGYKRLQRHFAGRSSDASQPAPTFAVASSRNTLHARKDISRLRSGSRSPALGNGSSLGRRLFLALGSVALIYALLAGLRTVSDPDLGWQMASGRWIAQHHQVFSTDVFSYTATGNAWIYPAGAELIFYAVYRLGGFALLSWLGAVTCAGTAALLLRRGSAFHAAVAILAIPLIAERTVPRAEMFTVVLFAD